MEERNGGSERVAGIVEQVSLRFEEWTHGRLM